MDPKVNPMLVQAAALQPKGCRMWKQCPDGQDKCESLLELLQQQRQSVCWAASARTQLQQLEGNYYSPLLSISKATPGIPCQAMGSLAQQGHHHTGASPAEGHQDDHTISKERLEDDTGITFHS